MEIDDESPDADTPKDLADALYIINEMATPKGMDGLLEEAKAKEISLDGHTEQSPADIALHVWLHDRDLVERKHAEQFITRKRSFEYYQTEADPVPQFRFLGRIIGSISRRGSITLDIASLYIPGGVSSFEVEKPSTGASSLFRAYFDRFALKDGAREEAPVLRCRMPDVNPPTYSAEEPYNNTLSSSFPSFTRMRAHARTGVYSCVRAW